MKPGRTAGNAAEPRHDLQGSRGHSARDDKLLIDETTPTASPWRRALGWFVGPRALLAAIVVGAVLRLGAAFVLTVEKIALIADPTYVPSCSINPVLSCGSVMATPQAEAFGFPNSLLGVAGFAVLAATGAALLAGARLAGWYWAGLQLGMTAAVVFVHWLAFQSLYRIGALCPYCMVVWAVVIPLFWYVTARNVAAGALGADPDGRLADGLRDWRGPLVFGTYLVVVLLVLERFWSYLSSLL